MEIIFKKKIFFFILINIFCLHNDLIFASNSFDVAKDKFIKNNFLDSDIAEKIVYRKLYNEKSGIINNQQNEKFDEEIFETVQNIFQNNENNIRKIVNQNQLHFYVMYDGKKYDSSTGENGAARQGINTCSFNSVDNFLYLEKFKNLNYSEFSKKIHSSDKNLRLFYGNIFLLADSFNNNIENKDYYFKKFNLIFSSISGDKNNINLVGESSLILEENFNLEIYPLLDQVIAERLINIKNLAVRENMLRYFGYTLQYLQNQLELENFDLDKDLPHLADWFLTEKEKEIVKLAINDKIFYFDKKTENVIHANFIQNNKLNNYLSEINKNNLNNFLSFINSYDINNIKSFSFFINNSNKIFQSRNNENIKNNVVNILLNFESNFYSINSIVFTAGYYYNYLNKQNNKEVEDVNNILLSLYYKNYNKTFNFLFGAFYTKQFISNKEINNSCSYGFFTQGYKEFNIEQYCSNIFDKIILSTNLQFIFSNKKNLFTNVNINKYFQINTKNIFENNNKILLNKKLINIENLLNINFNIGFEEKLIFNRKKDEFVKFDNPSFITEININVKKHFNINVNSNLTIKKRSDVKVTASINWMG